MSLAFYLKRYFSTGQRRLDPELLRQLQIPSFQEFRVGLKAARKTALNRASRSQQQTSQPHPQPHSSFDHAQKSISRETHPLLLAKHSSSASGLSEHELEAIQTLLSPAQNSAKRKLSEHSMHAISDQENLKIAPSFLARFPLPSSNVTREQQSAAKIQKLMRKTMDSLQPNGESGGVAGESVAGSKGLSLEQITSVVRVNSLMGNLVEAQAAFDLIREELRVQPDTFAINTLMDAYARVGDYKNAARVFKEFFNAKTNGTAQPDLISYSILIKACVEAGKLRSAFDVYEAMKSRNLHPTLQVYTTLIKGCITSTPRDLPRAWKTFEHMELEVCAPDATLYSLMIHACALDENPERALDLFARMHEKGLRANQVTYTSLLQACGSRADYYGECWGLLGQMVEQGWTVNVVACKVLIKVCAAQGDLGRLRTVWNWIVAKAAEGDHTMQPDAALYRSMFHAFGQCVRVSRRASRGVKPKPLPEASPYADEDANIATETNVETTDHTSTSLTPVQLPKYTFVEEIAPTHSLQHLHLNHIETNPHSIITDAATIWKHAMSTLDSASISSDLVDSYLGIYCAAPGNIVSATRALHIYDSMYKKGATAGKEPDTEECNDDAVLVNENGEIESTINTSRNAPDSVTLNINANSPASPDSLSKADETQQSSVLVPTTGWTYQLMLDIVTKDKKLMRTRGKDIWSDYLAWDAEKEKALVGLTALEKEAVRLRQGRGRNTFKKAFTLMSRGHARINEIGPALDMIEAATTFRDDPTYLPAIVFSDVPNLVEKVRDLAEEGDLVTAKRLKELCPPPPPKTAEEEARAMLQNKWVGGKNWWGWESLGIDENIRRKIIRKGKKENERIKQYWNEKRRK